MNSSFLSACGLGPHAVLPLDQDPLLLVVIDTEEEFDWGRPHCRDSTEVTSIAAQWRAQEIFTHHGIVPTYVVDYPVASNEAAVSHLAAFFGEGRCRIGAHLHPWVNPPHEEEVNPVNSYPGNLPAALERRKLAVLTEAIEQGFGVRPRVYKAGRYGVGPATAEIMEDLGYDIDLSVVPYTGFTADGGPDFTAVDFQPFWFGSQGTLLEIPLSCGFYGTFRSLGPALYPFSTEPLGMRLRLPGIFARLGLLERIRLTPEGISLDENKRLAKSLWQQGCRVFTYAYHSPSLVPGMTPYVTSESDLRVFLDSMDGFLEFFLGELGGRPSDPGEVYSLLKGTSGVGD